jgi:hypothetical protein
VGECNQTIRLLRACRERLCGGAAEQRNQLASM